MRPEEAFRATLSDCLAQMTANAATLRAGRSVEGLHQLRVAFRRLEVALEAFGEEFEQDWLEDCAAAPRFSPAGWARPAIWMSFSTELLATAPKSGNDSDGFPQPARPRRRSARHSLEGGGDCISGPGFRALHRRCRGPGPFAPSLGPRPQAAAHGAAHCSTARQAGEKARPKAAKSRKEADLHRLRIALKKLRYTAEFFAPLYPRRTVKPLSRANCAACRTIWASSTTSPMCAVVMAGLMRETSQEGRRRRHALCRRRRGGLVWRTSAACRQPRAEALEEVPARQTVLD